jgi:hypothetical protein
MVADGTIDGCCWMLSVVCLDSVNFLNLGNEDEGFVPAGAREAGKVSRTTFPVARLHSFRQDAC